MKTVSWSQLTLITFLLTPVVCIFVRDLDDSPIRTKPTIKTRIVTDKLLDDIDGQIDSDLIPPNFQPDPLLPLPVGDQDNFEDVGQLNKERIGDDPDDPFNRYIGHVFDSFPEASNIFDALRSNNPSDSPDSELSQIPPELLIPLLMNRRLSVDDDGQESKKGELQEATLRMAKLIVDSKHATNKSDKSTGNDQERKLVGKLSPLKSSSTILTSKGPKTKPTTDKTDESKEGIIDDKVDQVRRDEEVEEKSKKSTTKSSRFRPFDNPLIRWLTKTKSTTPKGDHTVQGKTTTDLGEVTTVGPKSSEYEDDGLTSSNSTLTVTPSSKSSKSSSTTIEPSTISTTTHGKVKSSSTTIQPNNSTTTPSTTGHSIKSDSEESTTTSKGKHSKATSTSKPSKTDKKEEGGDADKIESTKDPIDKSLSSLNVNLSNENVTSTSVNNSSVTKSEVKHSHKHETTSVPTLTTSTHVDRSTTIGPDSRLATNEPETKTTIKSTTIQSKDDDTFPTVSPTKSKTKSEANTTSTPRSLLTILGHKTRHPSTKTSGRLATTLIPTLRSYSDDSEDLLLPEWNPDIFP